MVDPARVLVFRFPVEYGRHLAKTHPKRKTNTSAPASKNSDHEFATAIESADGSADTSAARRWRQPFVVYVDAVRCVRRLSIDRHAESKRSAGRGGTHDERTSLRESGM